VRILSFSFFLFFLVVLEFELSLHLEPLHQPFFSFVKDFFRDIVLRTIRPGWLQTELLLISAS
jgi:hypothetical protein